MLRLPDRAVLSLDGPDTLALLERTVTHKVADWAEGTMRYGALLTPQGKVIADFLALRSASGVLIDVHRDAAEDLLNRLKLFRLRAAVDIAEAASLVVMAGDTGAADPRSPDLVRRWIAPPEPGQAGADARHIHAMRIEAGVPEQGADFCAGDVFPTDINMDLMGGIDYQKGCFVGQEVASRMKRRGKIRKRTIRVEGDDLEPGSEITGDGVIGEITSADDTGQSGLARIRLDRYAASLARHCPLVCNGYPIALRLTGPIADELAAIRDADDD